MADARQEHQRGQKPPDPLAPITEKQLAQLWQRRAARYSALRTETGRRVRVLYPGRLGVTAGPDFRNALLLVEGHGLVQGDVEVHLKQQDWRAHGHHADPNYNGVALHVALNVGGAPSRTDGGATPPVVDLETLLSGGQAEDVNEAETRRILWALLARRGYRQPDSAQQMTALLNRAGDERFLSRSRQLQMLASRQSPEQTLWETICEALGYRNNQHPFLALATAAPVDILAASARRLPVSEREPAIAAWLMRLAGFEDKAGSAPDWPLPSGLGPGLDARQWRMFRVRPSNHPRRRILGAAALLARHAESGLADGMIEATTGNSRALERSLAVRGRSANESALIGAARARDIAVNAILPFLHGAFLTAEDAPGAATTLELYRNSGPLADNEITRALSRTLQQPGWGRLADNARRQQGLIHLQRILAGSNPEQTNGGE